MDKNPDAAVPSSSSAKHQAPSIMVFETLAPKKFKLEFGGLKKTFIPGLLIFALLGTVYEVWRVSLWVTEKQVKQPQQTTQATNLRSSKLALERNISQAFDSSTSQNVIANMNLADQEQDLDARFQYYANAFKIMKAEYQKTKNPDLRIPLTKLKDHLQLFPQYRQSDFYINQ